MHTYIYMYNFAHVLTYIYIYVCMYVCTSVCMHVSMHLCTCWKIYIVTLVVHLWRDPSKTNRIPQE